MARFGSFQGPAQQYGLPPTMIAPPDNDITPDPNKAEADALASQTEALYDDLVNAQREQERAQRK